MVEEVVDATIGEAPTSVSSLRSRFGDACLVEFSERLGDRVGCGFNGGGELADGSFGRGMQCDEQFESCWISADGKGLGPEVGIWC